MSKKLIIPSKEELQSLYNTESISFIAKKYSTSNPTIRKWFAHHDIQRRSHLETTRLINSKKRQIIPSDFSDMYKRCSLKELQSIYEVGQETIYIWLNELNIDRKTLSQAISEQKERRFNEIFRISKEDLYEVYNKFKNKEALKDYFNISDAVLRKLFEEYQIPTLFTNRSIGEIKLLEICTLLDPNLKWENNVRGLIPGNLEVDILCKEKNLAIEYCGLYWHSEINGKKSKNYHYDKRKHLENIGIELLTIFESDDINKVKELVRKKLGLCTKKIQARKCIIKEISSIEAKKFHEQFHLSGYVGSSINLGLFYKEELIQVCSFAKSRFNKTYEYECTRNSTIENIAMSGGTSKLFSYFLKNYSKSLITYADFRFGSGKVYEKCSLKRIENSGPNYWYFSTKDTSKLYSRVSFQKHRLSNKLENFDPALTEWDNMQNNNYDRIFDCGNAVYVTI